MKAAQVIDEIRHLDPSEQAEVISFAIELARRRQLSAEELGEMAERLAGAASGSGEALEVGALSLHASALLGSRRRVPFRGCYVVQSERRSFASWP